MNALLKKLKEVFSASPGTALPGATPSIATKVPADTPKLDITLRDTILSGWFLEESRELFAGFAINDSDVVLDIGCGDGQFSYFCAAHGAEVILADIDEQRVKVAYDRLKKTFGSVVHCIVTDANPIPLPSESVAKVIALEVLEHVDSPEQFMQELVRVGEPGAQYLIAVPDPVAENLQRNLAPPSYFEKPNHIRVFERSAFKELITKSGLIIEREASYGFFWSMWWIFFWACKQDLLDPWHPVLQTWAKTWGELLNTEDGPKIKKILDEFMPKSQAIIARKAKT